MEKSLFYRLILLFIAIATFADAQIMANQKPLKNNFTGNWLNKTSTIDAGDTVVFDMSLAVCNGPYLIIPVSIISDDIIWAIDFSMKYDNNKITFDTIIDCKPYLNAAASYNVNDSTLRFTSFSFMQPIEHDTAVVAIRFNLLSLPVAGSDLNSILAYLNGDTCSYKLIDAVFPTTTITPNGPTIFMSGDSVLLTANASVGSTYLWSTGATTQTIVAYNTGTYTVTVTSTGGCNASSSANVYVMAPLPVQLIDFNVKQFNDEILIAWTATNEINNNYFTVERSANSVNWLDVKKINGSNTPNVIIHYNVIDPNPTTGINYYRIKQTDFNGTFKYSQIKSIRFNELQNNIQLTIFPNPAVDILNITSTQDANVILSDINGRTLLPPLFINRGEKTQLPLNHLPNGIYLLKLYNNENSIIEKLVIASN